MTDRIFDPEPNPMGTVITGDAKKGAEFVLSCPITVDTPPDGHAPRAEDFTVVMDFTGTSIEAAQIASDLAALALLAERMHDTLREQLRRAGVTGVDLAQRPKPPPSGPNPMN